MIIYLRDKKNRNVVDLDVYKKDGYIELGVVVDIKAYSMMLLSLPEEQKANAIDVFETVQELRGWLWEKQFGGRQNTDKEYDSVVEKLRSMLKEVSEQFDLYYVED